VEGQNGELQRIRAELNKSREKFRDLYDFAPIGYFTTDKNGIILSANLEFASMVDIAEAV